MKTEHEKFITDIATSIGGDGDEFFISRIKSIYESCKDLKDVVNMANKFIRGGGGSGKNKEFHFVELMVLPYMIKFNGKVFVLTENICKMFLNTTINTDVNLIKMPFDLFFVQCQSPIPVDYAGETHKQPIVGFYLLKKEDEILTFYLHKPKKREIKYDVSTSSINLKLHNKTKGLDAELNKDGGECENIGLLLNNFIFNVLLYLTSKDPDIIKQFDLPPKIPKKILKNPRSVRRFKEKHDCSKQEYYLVGSKDPDVKNYSEKNENPQAIQTKFQVSGHWHHYWTGSKYLENRERIHKWVKPYYKCKEYEEKNKLRIVVDKQI